MSTWTSFRVVAITSLEQLVAAPFNLLEPAKDLPALTESQMNNAICIVPALLVDTKGYRLGMVRGFYDRFLSTYPGKKICLAYQQNLSREMLPHTAFDVAVDVVITESVCTYVCIKNLLQFSITAGLCFSPSGYKQLVMLHL